MEEMDVSIGKNIKLDDQLEDKEIDTSANIHQQRILIKHTFADNLKT